MSLRYRDIILTFYLASSTAASPMLNIIGAFGATRFRPINPSKQSVISAVNIGKISELQIKFKNSTSNRSIWNLSKVEIACMDGNGTRIREIFRTLSGQDRIETDSVVSLKLGLPGHLPHVYVLIGSLSGGNRWNPR